MREVEGVHPDPRPNDSLYNKGGVRNSPIIKEGGPSSADPVKGGMTSPPRPVEGEVGSSLRPVEGRLGSSLWGGSDTPGESYKEWKASTGGRRRASRDCSCDIGDLEHLPDFRITPVQ